MLIRATTNQHFDWKKNTKLKQSILHYLLLKEWWNEKNRNDVDILCQKLRWLEWPTFKLKSCSHTNWLVKKNIFFKEFQKIHAMVSHMPWFRTHEESKEKIIIFYENFVQNYLIAVFSEGVGPAHFSIAGYWIGWRRCLKMGDQETVNRILP